MSNQALYEQLVDIHNRTFGTAISLESSFGIAVLPEADLDEQTISFSSKLEHLLLLFCLYYHNRQAGSRAIHHFLLYHLAMGRDLYPKAEELLSLLKEDLEVLKPTADEIHTCRLIVGLQACVVLGHEMSHIYYAQHPDIRKTHVDTMRERIISYKEQFNTGKPLFIRLLHFCFRNIRNLQEQAYDEAIGSDALQEELCCDESAWQVVGSMIREMKLDTETTARVCAYVGLTISFINTKRTLENIYLNPGKDIRERDLRFDTSRHTLHNKMVWDYMGEHGKKASRQFQSMVNDFQRMGYAFLMNSLKKEYEHVACVRFQPHGNYSLKETKRLESLYTSLWSF